MSCPGPAELAAIATSASDATHLGACARCRGVVEDQRAMRRLLAGTPFVAPDRDRVDRLAAEVIARSDLALAGPRRRVLGAVLAVVAAAAIVVVVLSVPRPRVRLAAGELRAVSTRSGERIAEPAPTPAPSPPAPVVAPAPAPEPAAVAGRGARFIRQHRQGSDELVLRDGTITVDGRDRRPVEITAGDTRVRVGDARVAVEARHGVIVMVTVIAGSAEISRDGHRQRIDTGLVWEPPAEPEPAHDEPDTLGAFTVGWTALRNGRLAEAIEAFDRATDPAVAEDAAYWAAVAAERLGNAGDARHRFDDFLARFPGSPRAAAARAALARLDAE